MPRKRVDLCVSSPRQSSLLWWSFQCSYPHDLLTRRLAFPDGNNLSKWFGNDLFKQQLPTMPPLPTQGQKVLTVDEIERRSQTVTN